MTAPLRFRRRRARGFSLLEAMISAAVFLWGLIGVMVLIVETSRMTRRTAVNAQFAQAARDEIQRRMVAGLQSMGPAGEDVNDTIMVFGLPMTRRAMVFDTGRVVGTEVTDQLPGCDNLGTAVPSRCVKVIVTDPGTQVRYVSTAYLTL